MEAKRKQLLLHPDREHEYRYHANLGTFLAHDGQLEAGLAEIERAVAQNPAAHFGRERFQIAALKYVIAAKRDPSVWLDDDLLSWNGYLPTSPDRGAHNLGLWWHPPRGLFSFRGTKSTESQEKEVAWREAFDGVAGMLRFGGLEGAELYRTLGDLLRGHGDVHLAWWAYHRAIDGGHPARELLRVAIEHIGENWRKAECPTRTESEFPPVKENGRQWLLAFQEAETRALAQGRDPGQTAVLRELITEANDRTPAAPIADWGCFFTRMIAMKILLGVLIACGATLAACVALLVRRKIRRRAQARA